MIVTILNKYIEKNNLHLTVRFDDNGSITEESFSIANPTVEGVKNYIKSRAASIASLPNVDAIPTGSFDIGDPTPPTPTQEEIDRKAFLQDLANLMRLDNLVSLGILTGTEPQFTTLKNKVKTNFKVEYLPYLPIR